jgi:type IV pilus assembly protein PilE
MAGVTLLELMIVVVVIAVLGAVAIPSYREYTRRAHRAEAKGALLRLATNQERFYLQNNAYSLDPVALGFAGGASEFGVYNITIATVAGVAQDYVATATPAPGGGMNGVNMATDDECTSFLLTSQGVRTATPLPNGTNGRCW